MTSALNSRLLRLERRHEEAAALGAEVLERLAVLEAEDPDAYAALTADLLAIIATTRERTR
ncbi:hypothetical protein AB0O22_12810 [Streptomyces sp. NPDC091204]|uniref:hypothetical protein n=1 Tax=Streptomyces sp. NPDC091204 TaxID=3155299 RepID=UPI0034221F4A